MKELIKMNILTVTTIKSTWANGYCKKYFLELEYNNKKYDFDYTDSVYNYKKNNALRNDDVIYCLLSDMNCFDSCIDIDDFANEFGYNKISELLNAYNGCKKTSEAMHEIFTDIELEQLQKEFEDY